MTVRPWFSRRVFGRSAADRLHPLSRRSVLRGVLRGSAVALALPWLESMTGVGVARACGGVIPRRFGLFVWGNGNLPERWVPQGQGLGEEWQLSEQLAPLAALKEYLCVVSGMSVKLPNLDPHVTGAAGILSAAPSTLIGSEFSFTQPTIDQVIANAVGQTTLYKSIQTGVTDVKGLSYNGVSSRNPPETDPFAFYERLFGDTFRAPGQDGLVDPRLGLRRSILDAVVTDIEALNRRISTSDQQRIDQHLTGVRELELRLARLEDNPPNLESCARPAAPEASYPDIEGRPQIRARNAVMAKMIAMALACDQTRVFGHYFSDPLNDVLFEGISAGHHDLTHNEPNPQHEVNDVTIQCMEGFAALLEELAAVPEEDGTLLDNCAVMATSDVSEGQRHAIEEMPIVIAGSCCGRIRTDYHYRSGSQENTTKVLISLMRAMDMLVDEYGVAEAWADDGISSIEG